MNQKQSLPVAETTNFLSYSQWSFCTIAFQEREGGRREPERKKEGRREEEGEGEGEGGGSRGREEEKEEERD